MSTSQKLITIKLKVSTKGPASQQIFASCPDFYVAEFQNWAIFMIFCVISVISSDNDIRIKYLGSKKWKMYGLKIELF